MISYDIRHIYIYIYINIYDIYIYDMISYRIYDDYYIYILYISYIYIYIWIYIYPYMGSCQRLPTSGISAFSKISMTAR